MPFDPQSLALGAAIGLALGTAITWPLVARRAAARGHAAREPELVALARDLQATGTQRDDLATRLATADQHLAHLRQRIDALADERATLAAQSERSAGLDRQLAATADELRQSRATQAQSQARAADLAARLEEQTRANEQRLREFDQRLKAEIGTLTQSLLDERTRSFGESSEKQLGGLLTPLREQLAQFRETVTQTHAAEQRERGALFNEIQSLRQLNQQITQEAANLTRALKGDVRSQGAWGEMVLERVLQASGLRAGREYEVQASQQDDDGARQRPDVIVRLPDEKDLVIDAKVSLVAYDRFVNGADEASCAQALREHVASVRRHIDGLSGKRYADLPGLRTLDFVLMFVPVEPAFVECLRADDSLYAYALERNIALVSPATLLATLRTVAHLWKLEQRNINSVEIAKRGALLYDNLALLVGELEQIGNQIEKMRGAHQGAMRRLTEGGRGSVLLQVQSLTELGVSPKKTLPSSLLAKAGAADEVADVVVDDASGNVSVGADSSQPGVGASTATTPMEQ